MSDLLELAITAHGGLELWQQVRKLNAHIAIGGGMWGLKGWAGVLADAQVSIDPHLQHAAYTPFIEAGQHSVWQAGLTEIVNNTTGIRQKREQPRKSFEGHTLMTKWDTQHLAYFTGYAMWTYLTTPFLFILPGFQVKEVEPWQEDGEIWRRLHVTFPANIESHSREQTFYFDEKTSILRRHDYSVDIMGGTSSANYALEPQTFGGLVIPTKRRVYTIGQGNLPIRDRLAVAIDFHSVSVI
jgi:hypothetical protein